MKGIKQAHVEEEEKKKSNICNTNNTKPGPSSTLKFQPSKSFALTEEENI
jgi:hypothetical protein